MIATEKTTADRIRSRVNRQSVQETLTTLLEHLKTYRTLPENGLLLWWSVDHHFSLVPPVPNARRIYRCDRRFDTELLRDLIAMNENRDTYGLIISTGDEYALALAGPTSDRARVLSRHCFYVRNRHGRGGQSSVRFERLANESRAAANSSIVEDCRKHWLDIHGRPTIRHLVVVAPEEGRRLLIDRMRLECPLLAGMVIAMLPVAASNLIEDGLTKALTACREHHGISTGEGRELSEWLRVESDRLIFGTEWILRALEDGVVEALCVTPELREEHRDLVQHAGKVIEMQQGLEGYQGLVALAYKGVYLGSYGSSLDEPLEE